MNNKNIVHVKLTELFMSKGKTMSDDIIIYWINELSSKFLIKHIVKAIDKLKLEPDDFPTIGKIATRINDIIYDEVFEMIKNRTPKGIELAKKSSVRLEYLLDGQLSQDSFNNAMDRMVDNYVESVNKYLIENNNKQIENG